MSDFSIDTRDFMEAFDFVISTVPKDVPKYLNKKALMVIIGGKGVKGAIQRTPRASEAAIKAVPVREVAGTVIKRAKRKGEWPLTGAEIKLRVKREYARRASSIAYTAGPGWNNAAVALGGRGVNKQAGFGKSEASHGLGKLATVQNPIAEIVNTAPASELIGTQPLNDALRDVARDMVEYGAVELLKKTLDAVSAK